MAAELASLVLKMSADSAQLRTDIKRVRRDMTGMRKSATDLEKGFRGVSRTLKTTFAAFGVGLGIRGIVRSIDNLTASLDSVAKTASRVGVTTDQLQELRFAAGQASVDTKTLDMAIQRFSRRLGEAAQGSGELKDTIESYGIAVRDSEGNTRSVVDVLGDFANVIRTAESDQERLRIAFKAFDSEGAALVNMLRDGSDGLDKMRSRARELGLVIDSETIRASVEFRDRLDELSKSFAALQAEALGPLLPKLTEYVEALRDAIREGGGVKQIVDELTDSLEQLGKVAAVVAGAGFGLSRGGPLGAAILGGATALSVYRQEIGKLIAIPKVQLLLERSNELPNFGNLPLPEGVSPIRIAPGGLPGDAGSPAPPIVRPVGDDTDNEAEKRQKRITGIIASLREEAETYGLSAEQVALYKLEQLGASDAQLAMASALTAKVGLLRDEEAAMEASRQSAEEAAEAIHSARMADQRLIEVLAEEISLMGMGNREREQERAVRRLSAEATDEQREAVRALAGALYDQQEAARQTGDEMSEFAIQGARNMQSAFADFLFDPFSQGLQGMLSGFVSVIHRMVSEALAAKLGEALFGSLLTGGTAAGDGGGTGLIGGLLAGLFHSGGIAGQASAHRSVSALAWAGAPRYHGGGIAGLKPDEVPAVLRLGEEVLTESDPRHRNNFGSEAPVVNLKNINAFDGQTVRDEMSTAAGERLILNVVSRNKRLLGIA